MSVDSDLHPNFSLVTRLRTAGDRDVGFMTMQGLLINKRFNRQNIVQGENLQSESIFTVKLALEFKILDRYKLSLRPLAT